MSISVIQQLDGGYSTSVTLGADVTAGNSVILGVAAYLGGQGAMDSLDPLYGGSPVTGAAKLIDGQSDAASGYNDYVALWLLPDLPGGSAAFSITETGDNGPFICWAIEVSGLGASPSAGPASAGNGTGGTVSSGTAAALSGQAIVTGLAGAGGADYGSPPASSPWTAYQLATGYGAGGYQVASSGALAWTPAASIGGDNWAAVIGAVYATAPPASPSGLLMASII